MRNEFEPPEPLRPGKRPVHDRDDSRQEREKDYVKQVQHPHQRQYQLHAGQKGRQQH